MFFFGFGLRRRIIDPNHRVHIGVEMK
jgi:hypothetical protein